MGGLNLNSISRLEEINQRLRPLASRFEKSFANGDISEAQKDLALKEVKELRNKALESETFSLDDREISHLEKGLEEKWINLKKKDTEDRKVSYLRDFDKVMKLARNIESLIVKEIILQGSVNSSAIISVTAANRKMVQEIFSKNVSQFLLPFENAKKYLHLLFCERTVVSGVEVYHRKISRSQQQELESFIEEKKLECETYLEKYKTKLESSKYLEDLFLKVLGYIEMEEVSAS